MSLPKPLARGKFFRAIVELKHALEENGVARGPLLSTNNDKNDVRVFPLLAFIHRLSVFNN